MPWKITIPEGTRFGRLVVLGESPVRKGSFVAWICRCDCGNRSVVAGVNLRYGHTLSCGCWKLQRIAETKRTHGLSDRVPEYKTWLSMRGRILNRNNPKYPQYGGRGITICPQWDDFAVFYGDMGPKPCPNHSLDRIDNDGPYSPENCRWSDAVSQSRNRRITRRISHDGTTLAVGEWAAIAGLSYAQLRKRLALGWSMERALSQPLIPRLDTSKGRP